mgnify:CR=1 FL=1
MIKTILTMYIIHIAGMVLCVGKEFYVIQILELFYVEIIIFPVIFDGQTPLGVVFRKIVYRDLQLYLLSISIMDSALNFLLVKIRWSDPSGLFHVLF